MRIVCSSNTTDTNENFNIPNVPPFARLFSPLTNAAELQLDNGIMKSLVVLFLHQGHCTDHSQQGYWGDREQAKNKDLQDIFAHLHTSQASAN